MRADDDRPRRPPQPRRPSRRSGRTRALIAAGILAACAAVAVALVLESGSPAAVTVPIDSVAVIDPRSGHVVKAIGVDESPGPIAAGARVVWVLNLSSETVSRIDARTRRLLGTKGVGDFPGNLVTSPQEVWVVVGECSNGGTPGKLLHLFTSRGGGIDLTGGDDVPLAGALPTSNAGTAPLATPGCGLAARGTAAWVATNIPPGVARVDYDPVAQQSDVAWARALARAPNAIAVGHGSVWIVDSSQEVVRRLDPSTGRRTAQLRAGANPVAIAADAEAVWVANEGDNSVSRIDPRNNAVRQAISVGDGPTAIAVGEGAVWVASAGDGSVARIDPRTNRVTATVRVGHRPQGIAVAGGLVWVTVRA